MAYLGVLENERIATMGGALKLMQQSVLISSIRGPDTLAKYHVSKLKWSKRSPDQYHLSPIFTFAVEIIQGLSLMEIVKTVRLVVVPRAGVEPARPYGQRILSPMKVPLPSLTKRYEPVFMRLAVVKVSLRLVTYQHVPPPS